MNNDSMSYDSELDYLRGFITSLKKGQNLKEPKYESAPKYRSILETLWHEYSIGGTEGALRALSKISKLHPELKDVFPSSRQLLSINDLAHQPHLKYLIPQKIIEGGLSILYGPSGSSKTFLGIQYAMELAREQVVVYLAAEGHNGFLKRIQAYGKHHNVQISNYKLYFDFAPIDLSNPTQVQDFCDSIAPYKPKLVIVDTLARSMDGDENSARDMGHVIRGCDYIRSKLNAALLLVHHTGKSSNSARGSSALKGAADVMISVQNKDGIIEIVCDKSKDDKPFEKHYLRMEEVKLDDDTSSCVLVPAKRTQTANPQNLTSIQLAILEELSLSIFIEAGATSRQIINSLEAGQSTIHNALSNLKNAGLVRQGKKGDPYFITEKGQKAIQDTDDSDPNSTTL